MPCRRLTIQEFESLQNPIPCSPETNCNGDEDCGIVWGPWTRDTEQNTCVRLGCQTICGDPTMGCTCYCEGTPDIFDFNNDLSLCPTNYSCDGNGNCIEDPAGPYTSIAECQENYRNCVVSGPGFCGWRYTRGVGWDLRYSTCTAGFECVDPNLWYGEDPCADCYPPAAACIQQ